MRRSTVARTVPRRAALMAKANRTYGTKPRGKSPTLMETPSATSNQEQAVNVRAIRIEQVNEKAQQWRGAPPPVLPDWIERSTGVPRHGLRCFGWAAVAGQRSYPQYPHEKRP